MKLVDSNRLKILSEKKNDLLCLECVFSHFIVYFMVKDEHINRSIMRSIRKYANKEHDDWDVHLQAIIYGINTTKHVSGFYLFI